MEFGTKMVNHTYVLCMAYCMYVNKCKHVNAAKRIKLGQRKDTQINIQTRDTENIFINK